MGCLPPITWRISPCIRRTTWVLEANFLFLAKVPPFAPAVDIWGVPHPYLFIYIYICIDRHTYFERVFAQNHIHNTNVQAYAYMIYIYIYIVYVYIYIDYRYTLPIIYMYVCIYIYIYTYIS